MSDRSRDELRQLSAPTAAAGAAPLAVVDLFAGCGGLSLGVHQAACEHGRALDVRLAVDFEPAAAAVYSSNFPEANVVVAGVETLFDGTDELTAKEQKTKHTVGSVDLLVGGPPCQGHSSLNNHTRLDDPKNRLYLLMARAAQVLNPRVVVIENVPTVLRDRSGVVVQTTELLERLGYRVDGRVLQLSSLGLAQRRKRHVLLAVRGQAVAPAEIFDALENREDATRNLEWAIGDLVDIKPEGKLDVPPRASEENLRRMRFLIDNDLYDLPNEMRPVCHQGPHSYRSMYGRLRWDEPAQTITSGFGSIGQGRYMHPDKARALTPHEAARIQGFPDYFDFSAISNRSALSTMIGNAVPPVLGRRLVEELINRGIV